jgi:hypothetical protein
MFIVAHESVNISETMLNNVKMGGGGKLNSVKNNIYDVVHPATYMSRLRQVKHGTFGIKGWLKLLCKFCRYQWKKHVCGYNPQAEHKNDEYDYDKMYENYAQ